MKYSPTAGDVVRYDPERGDRWCREGMAIAELRRDGRLVLLDTFWGRGGDQHALTADEIATAELLFNVGDYDELDRYSSQSPRQWEKFAPADRQVVTSQHRLQKRWFVRQGAVEHWPTQIDNARRVVAERESDLESAKRRVEWAREDLARVIEAAGVVS